MRESVGLRCPDCGTEIGRPDAPCTDCGYRARRRGALATAAWRVMRR
jgi:uncharacterized OB-fold protein